MSRGELIDYVTDYCEKSFCPECILRNKKWSFYRGDGACPNISMLSNEDLEKAIRLINKQTGSSPKNGGNNMDKQTITINLERYDELIKKEVLYDELTKNKGINMYLFQEVNEPLREGANNE